MLACRRLGWRSRQASVEGKTWVGKQARSIQKQSSAMPPTRTTCRARSTPAGAGAGLPMEHLSLARSHINALGKSKQACCWARSSALRRSTRAEKLPTSTKAMSRRAGLSTKATAIAAPPSNPSIWQSGLRFAKWRTPRLSGKAKSSDVAAGGSRRKLSFLSGGGGSGDTALVYGLVAVSFFLGLFTGHDPTRGSGQGGLKISRVGS